MFSVEVSFFLLSWRGFLLEGRRNWHAHHRGGVLGVRAGYLLASPEDHHYHLTRVTRLVNCLFQRGATVWGFGFVNQRQTYQWGRLFAGWRPGVLSNYFFVRVRRVHFARRVITAVRPRYKGRRRRRQSYSLAIRWARLHQRGSLPTQVYTSRLRRRAGLLKGYACVAGTFTRLAFASNVTFLRNWQAVSSWGASPWESRLRLRYLHTWWRTAQKYTAAVRSHQAINWFPRGGLQTVVLTKLGEAFATAVVTRQRQRSYRLVTPKWNIWGGTGCCATINRQATLSQAYRRKLTHPSGRRRSLVQVAARHIGWPSNFPGAVVAGGLTLVGSNLVHEVNGGGLPLLHFGGTSFVPTASVWHVNWNQQSSSLHGVKYLLITLWGIAYRAGVLRVVWRRLGQH